MIKIMKHFLLLASGLAQASTEPIQTDYIPIDRPLDWPTEPISTPPNQDTKKSVEQFKLNQLESLSKLKLE